MAEFTEHDLDDSRFTRVSLCRSSFEQVRLNGATFRDVDLVEVELDRRMPERSLI
ncbi:MAG: pentapeptide repeat-containing protein [Nostocoides sp.]